MHQWHWQAEISQTQLVVPEKAFEKRQAGEGEGQKKIEIGMRRATPWFSSSAIGSLTHICHWYPVGLLPVVLHLIEFVDLCSTVSAYELTSRDSISMRAFHWQLAQPNPTVLPMIRIWISIILILIWKKKLKSSNWNCNSNFLFGFILYWLEIMRKKPIWRATWIWE